MELRILGAHNAESKTTRLESHLIDKVLVLDAGGLTRSLSFEEQAGIRAVILSHRHFDHVRDLLPLGISLLNSGKTVDVYAIEDTVKFVSEKLLDGTLYPKHRYSACTPWSFSKNLMSWATRQWQCRCIMPFRRRVSR